MTTTVRLKYGFAGTSYDEQVYLTGGSYGFYLNDWVQQVSSNGEDVDEVFVVSCEGADKDDLSDVLRQLDFMTYYASESVRDITTGKFVQLEVKVKDESYTRIARVRHIEVHFEESLNRPPTSPGEFIPEFTVVITREPDWGKGIGTSGSLITCNHVGAFEDDDQWPGTGGGYYYDYGAQGYTVGGNRTSQLLRASCYALPFAGGPLMELWVGFRNDRYGDRTLFEPLWELEDAGAYGSDTSSLSDGSASGNYCVQYIPAAADDPLAPRVYIDMSRITTQYREQRGSFLVLMRAQCTGTRTYQVRMRSGMSYNLPQEMRTQRRVAVDNTNWFLYPMGYVDWPPGAFSEEQALGEGFLAASHLQIDAGVLQAGTGNLRMDFLFLIPTAQGFIYFDVKDYGVYWSNTITNYHMEAQLDHTGRVIGVGLKDWSPRTGAGPPIISKRNWGMPIGEGSVVAIAQRATSHVLTDGWRLYLYQNPQWHTLRGDMSGNLAEGFRSPT